MSRVKTEIEKEICSKFKGTRIPKKIIIDSNDREVTITLDGKMIVEEHMEIPGNAFEGWAIAARVCSKKNIILSVNDYSYFPKDKDRYVGHSHFSRFLYRIMKFTEQYRWFEVEELLKDVVCNFKDFLEREDLINTIPIKEVEDTERIEDENSVEANLAMLGELKKILGKEPDIGEGIVHRQLPVGLFIGKKSKDTEVFTCGRSAIDLWNKNGEIMNVIELKHKNNMIGIITEIFFYANYMLDLVDENGLFILADNKGSSSRGYDELEKGLMRVNGIMLADSYHPCVDARSLKVLNENSKKEKLKYYLAKYSADIIVTITKIEE